MRFFYLILTAISLITRSYASDSLNLDGLDPIDKQQRLTAIQTPAPIINSLFQVTKDVIDVFTEFNIPHMACYGTLLDIGRHSVIKEGRKVAGIKKHDDDIDLAIDLIYSSKIQELSPVFSSLGYDLKYDPRLSRWIVESRENTDVTLKTGEITQYRNFVDIFVFKEEADHFMLAESHARREPFLAHGWFTKNEFMNRQIYRFGPLYLQGPVDPKPYLLRKYGSKALTQAYFKSNHISPDIMQSYTWTICDDQDREPAFPSQLLEERFQVFKGSKIYQKIVNEIYWNRFYAQNTALKDPSSFAEFVRKNYMKKGSSVLEFGSGNGRDAFYFSKKGFDVTGVDYSETAIKQNALRAQEIHKHRPQFKAVDVTNEAQLNALGIADYIYGRFFLHALSDKDREPLMAYLGRQAKGTGVFFEFRTDKDPMLKRSVQLTGHNDYEGIAEGHYRCFINMERFVSQLKGLGYKILYAKEENNLSIFEKSGYVDNPFLARIVGTKK